MMKKRTYPESLVLQVGYKQRVVRFESKEQFQTWLRDQDETTTRLVHMCGFRREHKPVDYFQYNDGGRSKYFDAASVGDCVTRAIAIASGRDYKEVYDALNALAKSERTGRRKKKKSSSRNGVYRRTYQKYIESIGGQWVPCMGIGTGCKVHLKPDELPNGRLVVKTSKHLTAVVDGTIHDTYDPSRNGTRCVYGYYKFPA